MVNIFFIHVHTVSISNSMAHLSICDEKVVWKVGVMYMNVTYNVTECVHAQKSVVVRVGRAIFSAIYDLFMLLGCSFRVRIRRFHDATPD